MPSINQPTPRPAENSSGFRDKLLRLLGYGSSVEEQAELQPILDKMTAPEGYQGDLIREALSRHHGVAEILKQLSDPDLTSEESFELVEKLNAKYELEPEDRRGKAYEGSFVLPGGAQLKVKLYPELGNALFFSQSRPIYPKK